MREKSGMSRRITSTLKTRKAEAAGEFEESLAV
jgi:hypothetical protein